MLGKASCRYCMGCWCQNVLPVVSNHLVLTGQRNVPFFFLLNSVLFNEDAPAGVLLTVIMCSVVHSHGW